MKVSVFSVVLATLGAVTATPQLKADKIGLTTFSHNGSVYTGEDHATAALSAAKREVDTFLLQKRCSCGFTCYGPGNACVAGQCECGGQEGCYSCNGGPYVCQTTNADGTPNSCYQ